MSRSAYILGGLAALGGAALVFGGGRSKSDFLAEARAHLRHVERTVGITDETYNCILSSTTIDQALELCSIPQ